VSFHPNDPSQVTTVRNLSELAHLFTFRYLLKPVWRYGEQMKSLDLFFGIKAEQSLRDAVRNASETAGGDASTAELYPVGKKDWIAGLRLGETLTFQVLKNRQSDVQRKLISMGSHQRIRQDSLRVHAVRPPVPVFREHTEDREVDEKSLPNQDSVICPKCGTEVHRFNLLFGPRETVVGCYLCRGEPR
jgi:hypothetical protein